MTDKKTRIGYVLRRFPVLSETFVLNEILAMEARGFEVEIFSILQPRDPRFHENLSRLKANIRYLPDLSEFGSLRRYNERAYTSYGARYVKAAARHCRAPTRARIRTALQAGYVAQRVRERRIAHLHAHFANAVADMAALVHDMTGVPFSFTAHAVDIYKDDVDRAALAAKMRKASFVATVSDSNADFLRTLAPDQAGKVRRIYNGIDLGHFSVERGDAGDALSILCVARLVEKKGLDVLVRACAILRDQGRRFSCRILGKGAMRPVLNDLIRDLDLADTVRLVGVATQNEIVAHYAAADLFVLPCVVARDGNREGLPVSIVEALACGLPVVSTPVAGIPEAVRDGHNGLLTRERDPADLAAAIGRLFDDRALFGRMRRNARASVLERFDQEATYDDLAAALRRMPVEAEDEREAA